MYKACLFCNGPLGSNETIERFPVGQRLAFDADKGRLWVVCPRCARWNLTPLEERWEAIEQCEREFRGTRIRASTANIALGRLPSGLVLIRIGRPQGPEMATWRYAASFARRHWRAAAGISVLTGAVCAAAVMSGPFYWGVVVYGGLLTSAATRRLTGMRTAHIAPRGELPPDRFSVHGVRNARLALGADSSWSLRIDPTVGPTREFTGDAAKHLLRKTLPYINGIGASATNVMTAMDRLAPYVTPDEYIRLAARQSKRPSGLVFGSAERGTLIWLPSAERLALEMAVNEDVERRALEGELAPLEAAWREAEEIAAIADDLFLSESVRTKLRQLTGGR